MKGARNATIVPHGQHLSVEPARVEIFDVKPNMKYIQTINVRNLSPFVKRIRCIPPQSAEWTLVSENQTAIAAGISVQIDVEFLTRRPFDYEDKLIVQAEHFSCEVPLIAKGPCARIVFEPCIRFGTVKTKSPHSEMVTFRNEGSEPGSFELSGASKYLKISPASGDLAPKAEKQIMIHLMNDAPATVKDIIDVKLKGGSTLEPGYNGVCTMKQIDVYATCVDHSLHVFIDGKEVDSLDFGSLYHGQSKVIRAMLVNNGPTSVNFSCALSDEQALAAASAADRGGGNDDRADQTAALAASPSETQSKTEQPIQISPFQGQVGGFDRVPIEFSFSPGVHEPTKGFINTRRPEKHVTPFKFTGEISSEIVSGETITIPIKVSGEALLPALRVSPDHLQFGECPVNQRKDIVLRLTNSSQKMTLNYSIPRVPHMEINPMAGYLQPLQNQNVIVSFTPKALGKNNQDLVIKYCNDLYSHTMRIYANAPIIGEKKPPVKGLERTGRDFDPEHDFVDLDNLKIQDRPKARNMKSLTKIMKTNLVGNLNNSEALNSIIEDLPEPTPYSLSPSAMQEHLRNKQKYNNHIKETRIQRKKRERLERDGEPAPVDIHFDNDVNKGLTPGSGLKSPRYSVDEIKPEKLALARALDDESGARGVTGHRYNPDENKLIKKKFKAAATTQAEVRECSSPLEGWQLSLITVGPRMLDFGTMYVRSQATKSFSVFNDLPQAILVAISYDSENELSKSTPFSQVVPSAQPAGFDVTMCSSIPQTIQRQIVYTINGLHAFKFSVHAEITPVQINMSRTEMRFQFSEESLERTLTESMNLRNPGNAIARFSWEGLNQNFSVSPDKGIIRPGSSIQCDVTFTPPTSGQQLENFLTLKTDDGDDQSLRVQGQVPDASAVAFTVRRLDLGVLAVGYQFDRSITVKNDGKSKAVFHVENLAEGLHINPVKGYIPPESKIELDVHVLLDKPMQLDTSLTLNIRGGKPIKLGIVATAVVPNIEFVEDEIDFGQLTLGDRSSRPLSLKNTSAVDGTLYVNLQNYPEFTLALAESDPKERGEGEETEFDSSVLQPMTLQQYHYQIGTSMDAGATGASAAARSGVLGNGAQSPTGDEEDEEANSQIFKISVQPNYTLQMVLSYAPSDLATHHFEFPIVAADGVRSEGLKKIVRAEASRPRMLFSNTTLDFKTKVVATGVQAAATVKELGLHNADDHVIDWEIDTDDKLVKQGIFLIEPSRGTLRQEQECLVRVSFSPAEPQEYKCELDVFMSPPRSSDSQAPDDVDSQVALPPDRSKRYLSLRLRGCGTVPQLTFDKREVILPIVPLNVESKYEFNVVNQGYESLEVKYRLPTDTHRIPLTINFPEGQQLGITKPKIPVQICFKSEKPISFCAKIEFCDNDNGVYPIPISGTAENCILTCHKYLGENAENYTLDGDPPLLKEKEEKKAEDQASAVKSGSGSGSYAMEATAQAEFLVRWMNSNVLRNTIESFPHDLVTSSGRQLYDMIEFLSGKAVPAARRAGESGPNTRANMGSSQRTRNREMIKINQLMGQYESMLTFLKQHGGLLAHVKPEHFLSLDQYLRFQQSQVPGTKRVSTEKQFYPKSIEAWLSCILQTIKIFLLNRITPRHYKTLPGLTEQIDQPVSPPIDDAATQDQVVQEVKRLPPLLQAYLDPKGLTDSNICSVSECILLRWLNFHFARANKDRYNIKPVSTFDEDLQDSIVLSVVIESHVPNCQAVRNMKFPCQRLEDFEENAMLICTALQDIGLQFPIQHTDIAQPNPKDMLLFVMFLFQNLPHYVPKTVIVFATMLGYPKTQNIELTNPSRRAITYHVSMEGSNDFVIKEDTVRIEPRQTVSFPVEYQSRF
jgi:hypothetical protein